MGAVRRTAVFNSRRMSNFAHHRTGVRTTDGDIYLLL